MHNFLNTVRATIIKVIVAFLFILIVVGVYKSLFEEKVETVIGLINMITVDENLKTLDPILKEGSLLHKPIYGSNYATLKIPSIDVNLPVYYGESLSVLKQGIGHDSSTYFPGEGGTIVYMGHNFKTFLAKLPEAQIGDSIEVETTYGTFEYIIYDTKIVDETNTAAVPVNQDEEILVIYTCWPINNIGHASQRYLVYAK